MGLDDESKRANEMNRRGEEVTFADENGSRVTKTYDSLRRVVKIEIAYAAGVAGDGGPVPGAIDTVDEPADGGDKVTRGFDEEGRRDSGVSTVLGVRRTPIRLGFLGFGLGAGRDRSLEPIRELSAERGTEARRSVHSNWGDQSSIAAVERSPLFRGAKGDIGVACGDGQL